MKNAFCSLLIKTIPKYKVARTDYFDCKTKTDNQQHISEVMDETITK